jgi:prepilin-type processing-associated H-X9-DG protein
MYGEMSGRTYSTENNAFDRGWFGTGALPTYWGLANGPNSFWYQFSSNHTGVVQFAFADGSVHALRTGSTATSPGVGTGGVPSSDWIVYQQMAGMQDGTIYNLSQLSQ